MSEELSFVEVLMIQYQSGDKEYESFLVNEVHCFDVEEWGEAVKEIKEVKEAQLENKRREEQAPFKGKWKVWEAPIRFNEPDLLITKPLTAFQFRCFGQSFERGYSSGIDWEVSQMDNEYVFKDWVEQLKELGNRVLADKQAMGHPKADGKTIRFITLWSYSAWQDSYYHEWNSEWELLGSIDPKQIMLAIKEAEPLTDGLMVTGELSEPPF